MHWILKASLGARQDYQWKWLIVDSEHHKIYLLCYFLLLLLVISLGLLHSAYFSYPLIRKKLMSVIFGTISSDRENKELTHHRSSFASGKGIQYKFQPLHEFDQYDLPSIPSANELSPDSPFNDRFLQLTCRNTSNGDPMIKISEDVIAQYKNKFHESNILAVTDVIDGRQLVESSGSISSPVQEVQYGK